LVAPVEIGDGALVAAGSTISTSVEADAIALTRAPQKSIEKGALRFRSKRQKNS
jgi:bifunctional UDP-N-acetylglucosamine pyrophosphorylase/glucosamine-1-phosphate N-acetyltransferase